MSCIYLLDFYEIMWNQATFFKLWSPVALEIDVLWVSWWKVLLSFSFSQLNWRSSWMCGGDREPLMVKIIYNFCPHQHLNNKHVKQLKFTTFLHISCLCIGIAAWGSIRSFYYHLFDIELFSKQDDKRWAHCGPFSTVTGGHFKAFAASLSEWKLTGQRLGGSGSKTPSFAPFWLFWSVR